MFISSYRARNYRGGKVLVQTLRSNNRWQDLPILMVSAVVPLKEILGILELGASRFIPKPIDTNELKTFITYYLSWPQESEHVI